LQEIAEKQTSLKRLKEEKDEEVQSLQGEIRRIRTEMETRLQHKEVQLDEQTKVLNQFRQVRIIPLFHEIVCFPLQLEEI
jgi:DNA-binding transcriptional regulator GbsR (MarR family)